MVEPLDYPAKLVVSLFLMAGLVEARRVPQMGFFVGCSSWGQGG